MEVSNDGAIVVGVDGTEPSERAAQWAARQAAVLDKPLLLVYAMQWLVHTQAHLHAPVGIGVMEPGVTEEPMRRWARDMLEGLAEHCRHTADVDVHTEIFSGDPADAVILAADRVVFVVVGHSDHGGVAEFLLGSTAQRLARSCPWPVVVVRDEVAVDGRHDDGPVVVGVDGSPVSGRALRFAFEFAARHAAEVVVLQAADGETTTMVEPVETHDEAVLREGGTVGTELAACAQRHPGVRHQLVSVGGPAVDALLSASTEASLLVVGSHDKGAVRRAFMGSVSHEVVDSASCPVAVLSPQTVESGPR
ncbi:Nucleotide-binding universal stress protein, UspA family [Lentzea xinjiangensis]|uniref:Nucleotide-binding universal stress protein, UspA family n=1 Tax=Lentzea xinjiangensis TaxID=402600 RepID=A0A1H9RTW0_9PSEU|nr:universal stress protein [Lentzea xinjiangensis]SER76371.1 Nucleotide-binding universal stress protein, UspA family [Lentzea xinjiangensis]